jgi:hypothetical protein
VIYRVAVAADGQPWPGFHAVEVDAPNEYDAGQRALALVRAKLYVVEILDGPETSDRIMRRYQPRHSY